MAKKNDEITTESDAPLNAPGPEAPVVPELAPGVDDEREDQVEGLAAAPVLAPSLECVDDVSLDEPEIERQLIALSQVIAACRDRMRVLRVVQQKLYATNATATDSQGLAKANAHYFERQAEIRERRADVIRQLAETPLPLAELRALLTRGSAQIDVAMARRNPRGTARPVAMIGR